MSPLRRPSALFLPLAFLIPTSIFAVLTNLTVDDTNTTFFNFIDADANPPSWAAISPGDPCAYCSAQPQTVSIYDQTWHDGSVGSAGSLTFQGSAVYMYGIDLADPANISFTMDNTNKSFHYYNGTQQFVFDALFFSVQNLAQGVNHTVSWVINESKTNGTTGLFDYAVVTVEESAAPSSSAVPNQGGATTTFKKSKAGAIAGAVVASIGGLILIGGIVFVLLRRGRKTAADDAAATMPQTYDIQPSEAAATTSGRMESKTLDVGWSDPTRPASMTTSPTVTLPRDPEMSTLAPTVSTMTGSAREQFLEDRLAILEAHMNQHLPPPYVPSEEA
ncbi:hypothetical protein DFH08DRAFT_1085026 [Mycena albidolilacea]|uniref:Uncharacterized protein n=1 Tax=Mycena albidolilacea TaxID=1033008 RepID=A0AAD6ZJI3_9AGAR|nr:hypothetical protein DFH08DRAFT_1085026 [Mycena albidolilacea]